MKYLTRSLFLITLFYLSQYSAGDKTNSDVLDDKMSKAISVQSKSILKIALAAYKDKHYEQARKFLDNCFVHGTYKVDSKYKQDVDRAQKKLQEAERKMETPSEKAKYKRFLTSSKAHKLEDKYWKNYQKKVLGKKYKEHLKILKWCQSSYPEGIEKICKEIIRFNHHKENKEAHIALEHVKLAPYGWLSKEDAIQAKKGLVKVDDKWLTKEEISKTKGAFTRSFSVSFPESSIDFVMERFSWKKPDKKSNYILHHYKIADESFELFVPDNYDSKEKYGLFVFISGGGEKGNCFKEWKQVLSDSKMIYIGANKSGNKHDSIRRRSALAVEAALNMKLCYNIDDSRIYVSGISGGGRVSSGVSLAYPDIFTGALYMCGCNGISAPGGKWSLPSDKSMIKQIKSKSRFVFLTGSKDYNRQDTIRVMSSYKNSKIENLKYICVPDMGHTRPNAKWFKEGVDYLDGK